MNDDGPAPVGQRGLMTQALSKAAQGDAAGMLRALTSSGFLVGLTRQVADQYDALPRDEVETCIAEALDDFFVAASTGRRITNPGGWLWKTAWNKAHALWMREFKGREASDGQDAPAADAEDPRDRAAADGRADRLRDEALRQARALAPQVGRGLVVEVLTLLLDAVEQGLPDLPAKDVAETLGIDEPSARALASRALKRLERAARDAGITLPDDLARGAPDAEDETAPPP